jgi:hypothetical protein
MSDPLRLQQPFGTSALACAREDQHTLKGADGVAEEGEVVGARVGAARNRLIGWGYLEAGCLGD